MSILSKVFSSNRTRNRGMVFGLILLGALLAFEMSNYLSTNVALQDILGPLSLFGIRWSTVLSIAFCGIDFAGLARIFTPEEGPNEPKEVWWLFGAWVLAATFDATLTWWSINVGMITMSSQSVMLARNPQFSEVVPIVGAAGELLVRVLIIHTFAMQGEKLFSLGTGNNSGSRIPRPAQQQPLRPTSSSPSYAPQPRPTASPQPRPPYNEPTYHPVGTEARDNRDPRR